MTRPYSSDLRERVLRAHLDGKPVRSVVARLGASVSSVPKRVARCRATGSVAPGRIGGHRRWLLEPHRERVHAGGGNAAPDPRPAAGGAGERRHHGVPGHDLAVPAPGEPALQKKQFTLVQMRAAAARKRARWRELWRQLNPDRLVFVDETWIKTNMAPLRGWAPKGHRLKVSVPDENAIPAPK